MDMLGLIDALASLEPAELKGVELLRQFRLQTGAWFPTGETVESARAEMLAATVELITYGEDSRAMADRLTNLAPVPLAVPITEYSL